MIRLFVEPSKIDLKTRAARIDGQDHQRLARVLRAHVGQEIVLLDGLGAAFRAVLASIQRTESIAEIVERLETVAEPEPHITVCQALGKSDKFEQVIQHGTEAGACAFIPIETERTIATLPEDRRAERAARWRAIVKGASEQSCRSRIPCVGPLQRLMEVLDAAAPAVTPALLLHTEAPAAPLYEVLKRFPAQPRQLFVLVGPEGGWSAAELDAAARAGCGFVSLGARVLRTETAALVAISQILYHYSRPLEIPTCEF